MQAEPESYLVPLGNSEFKLTVKGSKFVGWCSPARDESEAIELIKQRSRKHHNATHNCWAYRIGDPSQQTERSSDEDEPSGTAGRPILEQFNKMNLFGVVMVVSRWFGGTKLGKGGLKRAYSDCAAETVKLLKTKIRHPEITIVVECGYDLIGLVERTAVKCKGHIEDGVYTEKARITIRLPLGKTGIFKELLSENGAGRVIIHT